MNKTIIEPYLTFGGRCEEALEFYKNALGATVEMVLRFEDSPDPVPEGMLPPGFEKKIMHSAFRVGGSLIMATDGCEASGGFGGFSLSISVGDEKEARRLFAALAEGGTISMPLEKTFWSPLFGMVADRFGVSWMINLCVPGSEGCIS